MLWTMWQALARWDDGGKRRLGDSRLRREEALRLSVQTGHLLTWSEDRRGSLQPGKDADLVVLGGDPLTCPEDALKDLSVDLTLVGGRVVHERGKDGHA
jgi:predicted amidohydrolase YtcJ